MKLSKSLKNHLSHDSVHPCDKESFGGCDKAVGNCVKELANHCTCPAEEGYELDKDGRLCKKSKSLFCVYFNINCFCINRM